MLKFRLAFNKYGFIIVWNRFLSTCWNSGPSEWWTQISVPYNMAECLHLLMPSWLPLTDGCTCCLQHFRHKWLTTFYSNKYLMLLFHVVVITGSNASLADTSIRAIQLLAQKKKQKKLMQTSPMMGETGVPSFSSKSSGLWLPHNMSALGWHVLVLLATCMMATNSTRLSTFCDGVSPVVTPFTAMTELRKKYLQLYCRNWNSSWYKVCFTSSDGHCIHIHTISCMCIAYHIISCVFVYFLVIPVKLSFVNWRQLIYLLTLLYHT